MIVTVAVVCSFYVAVSKDFAKSPAEEAKAFDPVAQTRSMNWRL
jgi:hypothetical protein